MQTTDFLLNTRLISKLHESLLKDVCEQYHLALIEANIISFLHNNPGKDTAGDIVDLRRLSKGNVSQGVESLIQKRLLLRTPDQSDRRKIHLSLLPDAATITHTIDELQAELAACLFQDFSAQEFELFHTLNRRLMENAKNASKRRDS